MIGSSRPLSIWRTSALLLTLLLPATALASHETIVIDGNLTDLIQVVTDNLGPDKGGFSTPDPLGEIYPVGGCSFVNGYDIRQTYVFLDFEDAMGNPTPNNITLYAGWDMEGMVGDVDGDGNPNTFDPTGPGAACGAFADATGIGDDSSYSVLLNLDCTGAIDDVRIQIKGNAVLRIVGGVPSVIPGAQFAFIGDKLELKIPNYQDVASGLPIETDICNSRIILLANAEFDFLAEDLTSAVQLDLAPSILVEKNPPVQDICAGESIDWTITVTNNGICRLDDVIVEDILGNGMSFGSSNVMPTSVVGQTIRWEYPGINLDPGQTINLTLTATTMTTCTSPVQTNNVTVEGAHFNHCLTPGSPPATATSMDEATVNCRDLPPCNITGDLNTCFPSTETYSTTVGAPYTRAWSVTSTPPGICSTSSPLDGASITVSFTGAGVCTISLTVTDPLNPDVCQETCTRLVTVNPQPPCDISGDPAVCLLDPGPTNRTYTTTVGAQYNRQWSATSNPPGICNIPGATDGGSVTVNFTGAGICTLTLTVTDPNDPGDCGHACVQIIQVSDAPPCNITGDPTTCFPSTETYSTTIGAPYTRAWSITSTPPGICNTTSVLSGSSITVNFTGAGVCTVSLTITDPQNQASCQETCTQLVTVNSQPPCDIDGPATASVGSTVAFMTSLNPGDYDLSWSASSDPADICAIVGPTTGVASINVMFTGVGACTVMLEVRDPDNPDICINTCTLIVTVEPNDSFACPHTIGFWRQQCAQRGNGSTKVCRDGMENLWRCVMDETDVVQWQKNGGGFETTASLAALSDAILFDRLCSQLQGPRPMTGLDMAEIQYLGLMLNVCSGALPLDVEISNTFNGTVAEAIDAIENAINTGVNVGYWKDIADNINNGIGILAVACPDGDDLFRNLPGCESMAPGMIGSTNFDGVETLSTRPFPNPVTSGTASFIWFIPTGTASASVGITIFDVTGRVVRTMDLGVQSPGEHAVDWDLRDEDGGNIPSGIYFYRLNVGQETVTEKLMVVRR